MILAILSILAILILFLLLDGLSVVGEMLTRLFPSAPLKAGDKAHVYLNGDYNRAAIISRVSDNKLYLYDGRLDLPVDYRGRFYAVGVDQEDGSRLVYLGHRKHFRLVRAAELVRKAFSVIDDEEMLPVSESQDDEAEETEEEKEA